ncbi:MAG: FAD-dependent monooxygenase, partial [Dermatophilaceae bacterium]
RHPHWQGERYEGCGTGIGGLLVSAVVVVGGGPAGVVLTYLLARAGVHVTLLEARGDFERRFRGDTLAPCVMEYLDALGLADPLLAEVPHATSQTFRWHTPTRTLTLADYSAASVKFGYYALIPQARFLPWLADRARSYGARVELGARFSSLEHDANGRVSGVRYSRQGGEFVVPASLVVGADGRSSKVRQASGLRAIELGASLDIVWHTLPRRDADPALSGLDLFSGPGTTMVLLGQAEPTWQLGVTIPAGTFGEVRERGVEAFRASVAVSLPWLTDRLDTIGSINDLTLLPVRVTTVERWTRPGLLLLGDAAHVISPVGGNGINFAIADAAEAANRLAPVLLGGGDDGQVDAAAAAVESARRPRVEREQRFQARVERSTAARLAARAPGPPAGLYVVGLLPGLARLIGRRSRVDIPAPVPEVLRGG